MDAILAGTASGTNALERSNGETQRRVGVRVWTHSIDAPTISAQALTNEHAKLGRPQVATTVKRTSDSSIDENAKQRKGKKEPWSWTWNSYCHMHARGALLDYESGPLLSASFKALSDEERTYYEDIGKDAKYRYRSGFDAFPNDGPLAIAPPVSEPLHQIQNAVAILL